MQNTRIIPILLTHGGTSMTLRGQRVTVARSPAPQKTGTVEQYFFNAILGLVTAEIWIWSRTALNTLQKLLQIAARLFDGRDFLRPQHSAVLVPVRLNRTIATAHDRRARRPGASTAFVSTAR